MIYQNKSDVNESAAAGTGPRKLADAIAARRGQQVPKDPSELFAPATWESVRADARQQPTAPTDGRSAKTDASSEAIEFLKWFDATGWHGLVALPPAGGPPVEALTIRPGDWRSVRGFVERHDGRHNLYFSANEPRPDAPNAKLGKSDIGAIRCVFADIDPDKALPFAQARSVVEGTVERLNAHALAPSVVVDSGGGANVYWLLPEKVDATRNGKLAEAIGSGVAHWWSSDSVQNVDRILRLPGTMNIPGPKKAATGRVPRRAAVMWSNERRYTLDEISTAFPTVSFGRPAKDDEDERVRLAAQQIDIESARRCTEMSDLDAELQSRFRAALADNTALRLLWDGDPAGLLKDDRSDSGWRFSLAARLGEAGVFGPQDYAELLHVWPAQQDATDKMDLRQVSREWARGGQPARDRITQWLEDPDVANWLDQYWRDDSRERPNGHDSPPTAGIAIVTGPIDPRQLPVREYIVDPLLPVGDVVQIVGEPGISKSSLATFLALAITSGDEALFRAGSSQLMHLHRPGPVLVCNAEDRLEEMQRRLAAAQRHYEVGAEGQEIILWSGADGEPLQLLRRNGDRGALKRAPGADVLERLIDLHKPVLVVLDPQVSLMSGSVENSNDDINDLYQLLGGIAARKRICVLTIHHTSKSTRNAAGDMGAGRGGFAAVGKARVAATLTRVDGHGAGEKGWDLPSGDPLIRLDFSKMSHAAKPSHPIVFKRASVPVGNGSGFGGQSAGEILAAAPRVRLLAEGDRAPVLELVDVSSLQAPTAPTRSVTDNEAEAVARIVSSVMGDRDVCPWGPLWKPVGERLRAEGITEAEGRRPLTELVVGALCRGVATLHNGQSVLLTVRKSGSQTNAPLILSRTSAADDAGANAVVGHVGPVVGDKEKTQ